MAVSPRNQHLLAFWQRALAFGRIRLWVLKIRTLNCAYYGEIVTFPSRFPSAVCGTSGFENQAAGCCIRLWFPSLGLRHETVSCCYQKTFGLFLSYQDLLSRVSLLGMETTQMTFLFWQSEAKNS